MADTEVLNQETEQAVEQAPSELPDVGPSGEADQTETQPQQQQQPNQAQTQQQQQPSWWKPDLFRLKYRGQTVSPRDYNHATQLMQQGWSYSQRMAELNRQQQEIEADKARYSQYAQLDDAFRMNPAFAQQIWAMYQQAAAQQGGATAPQSQTDPAYQQMYQMMSQMQQRLQNFDNQRADQEVESEIGTLRQQYPQTQWDAITESGHSLLWDVINHAYSGRFPSLNAAYRDYMWDSVQANARGQAVQQQTQARQRAARQGVVDAGAPAPAKGKERVNLHSSSYDDLTDMALRDLGLKK